MKKILLVLIVFTSCAPVYVPNIRNSPMFTKGQEFQFSGQLGNGLDGQVAYSITNHFGILANYNYINNKPSNTSNTDDNYLTHKFFEGGVGYFENKDNMFFEIFGGYGKGEGFSSGNFYGVTDAKGKYDRFFIQPGFGFNRKMVHVSFVPRISMVDFKEYTSGSTTLVVNEDPQFFFEPGVVTRVNTSNNRFFFTFQGGASISFNTNLYFDHRPFQFGTGIGFRFGAVNPESK
jgi:hypothetical protein